MTGRDGSRTFNRGVRKASLRKDTGTTRMRSQTGLGEL